MTFLMNDFLGTPVWSWLLFLSVVVALLAFDLGVLHKDEREIGVRESLLLSAGYIAAALLFGSGIWWQMGAESGMAYYTGFLIEKSLSMDNVFVIALIFSYFAIPRRYQHRVLFWGILGVIVLRALMIGLGTALVSQFGWVMYVFGAFLVYTGVKMWRMVDEEPDIANNAILKFLKRRMRVTDDLRGNAFTVVETDPVTQRKTRFATPLLLALVLIEFVDLLFAGGLGAGHFCHHDRPLHCLHQQYLRHFGSARLVLRPVGADTPLSLSEVCAGACVGVHRRQDLPARSDR